MTDVGRLTTTSPLVGIAVWGAYLADRRAEAWADLNAMERDGTVAGWVIDWVSDRPYQVGDRFTLVSEECDSVGAELVEIFAGHPMHGRFRVNEPWKSRGASA